MVHLRTPAFGEQFVHVAVQFLLRVEQSLTQDRELTDFLAAR